MSDEVFEVITTFSDVAELGQGYINRADGERILLPLKTQCEIGEGVRFIVHLADGTPAFAGAGRCVQASDQGPEAGDDRYETLLDSLAFDDRSRPVYDYVVAVRQAVYAAGGPDAQAEAASAEAEVQADAEAIADAEAAMEDPTRFMPAYEETVDAGSAPPAAPVTFSEPTAEATNYETETVAADDDMGDPAETAGFGEAVEAAVAVASVRPAPMASTPPIAADAYLEDEAVVEPDPAEFVIKPLARGMLQRAAVAAHWQPTPPAPPRPSRRTGLFRYPPGALPVPARPPRPALDPSLWVQPAPGPSPSMRP